jgi:hypothetical protein
MSFLMGICIGGLGVEIWFELQGSTSKNDFCRIFAKSGVLPRLVNTLHNLNEAARAGLQAGSPSTNSSTVENPANKPSGIIYFVVPETYCCHLLDTQEIHHRFVFISRTKAGSGRSLKLHKQWAAASYFESCCWLKNEDCFASRVVHKRM